MDLSAKGDRLTKPIMGLDQEQRMDTYLSDEHSESIEVKSAWRRWPAVLLRSRLAGKVRRLYLMLFRPEYVRQQRALRFGQCKGCGDCCRLVYRCVFLRRGNRCLIYGGPRPGSCRAFPIDWRDLADVRGACGFRFATEDGNRERRKKSVGEGSAVPVPERHAAQAAQPGRLRHTRSDRA